MASAIRTSCHDPHVQLGWHFPLGESFPSFGIHVDNRFHHGANARRPVCLLYHTGCHRARGVSFNHPWRLWSKILDLQQQQLSSFSGSSFCPSYISACFPKAHFLTSTPSLNPIIPVKQITGHLSAKPEPSTNSVGNIKGHHYASRQEWKSKHLCPLHLGIWITRKSTVKHWMEKHFPYTEHE